MKLNLGCGNHYAPPPWVNADVTDQVRCDVIVDRADPFATFPDESCERVYLGHVLEHVPWPEVAGLLGEVARVLVPGGEVMVVGPDIYRTIDRYRQGLEPWDIVDAVLDHADRDSADWPGCHHQWSCHEARVVTALTGAGFLDVVAFPVRPEHTVGWPTTAHSEWQCGARGRVNAPR